MKLTKKDLSAIQTLRRAKILIDDMEKDGIDIGEMHHQICMRIAEFGITCNREGTKYFIDDVMKAGAVKEININMIKCMLRKEMLEAAPFTNRQVDALLISFFQRVQRKMLSLDPNDKVFVNYSVTGKI